MTVKMKTKCKTIYFYLFLLVLAVLVATRLKRLSSDGCGSMLDKI